MMLYPAMRDLLAKVPSRYQLVNVVACRARQIASEAETAGVPLDDKPVSIAIREVAEGQLDVSESYGRGGDRYRESGGQGGGIQSDLRHRQAL